MSGTPFRSDTRAIPFVTYAGDEAVPDYEYGYGDALRDGRVVRPVYFPRTNGHMEWAAPDGSLHAATFDDPLNAARASERLRTRLTSVRDKVVRQLEKLGVDVGDPPPCGMFLWVDTHCDTNVLTEKAMEQGFLLAPGCLFSPSQLPSTRMRINIASMADPGIWRFLEHELGR